MKGTVKFYNAEKGFGFIYSEGLKEDIFFRIKEWKHPSVPNGNDNVEYELTDDEKGFCAINIRVIQSASAKQNTGHSSHKNDDRISCPSCGKKVVPRMVTYQGEPDKTLCPYCGTVIKKFENNHCLMVHLYGGRPHIHLDQLREFRDEKLLSNSMGKVAVKIYYFISPSLIKVIKNRQRITQIIRMGLESIIDFMMHHHHVRYNKIGIEKSEGR